MEPLRTASRNRGETAAAPGDRTGGLTASEPTHGGPPPVCYPGYSRRCDTRSHVMSELVEEVWLMPET